MKKWHRIAIPLSVAAVVIAGGCSSDDSGLDRRYKVTGMVTYKGQPLSKGGITFEPAGKGRFATGDIENGSYSLTTSTPGDGALPGDYKIVIVASDVDIAAMAKKTGGQLHQGDEAHVKAIKEAKSLVPQKYNRSETSGLKASVTAGGTNKFDFDLKDE
jgi:hypothetical protein